MKKIKITIILIMALFSFIDGFAQGRTVVRGRVVDQADKSPVIGATVVEMDKDGRVVSGTTSDMNGDFTYEVRNMSNVLKISVIGYNAAEVKPDAAKPMMVQLTSSDVEIEQVTITAKQRTSSTLTNIEERDRASSAVKVDLMEMQDVGVTSAIDALQGKVAGLDIMSASGDPGSGSQIVIRGLSSMGNSKPLIVINGVPQDRVSSNFDLSSADSEDISNMINIAMQDIKSIEVLKDAGATAIYGAKGADGVLLIETRTGKMGKVQFDYNYKHTFSYQPPAIPMLTGDEYVMLQIEQLHNAYGTFELPDEIANNRDYVDYYNYSANTDWVKEITQNANTMDHYLSLSGGGDKTRYAASFSYVDEGGTTINTFSNRFSTRINLDYFLSKRMQYTVNFSYFTNNTRKSVELDEYSGSWRKRNVREMAYLKAPNMSIYEYDELGNNTGEYFNPIRSYQGDGRYYYNPVAVGRLGKNDNKLTQMETSFKFRYTINDWLTFRESVAFQYDGNKSNVFLPYSAMGVDWIDWMVNKAEEGNSMQTNVHTETSFVFNAPFDPKVHDLSGVFTVATQQNRNEWVNLQSNRIPSTDIQDPAVDAQINWIGTSMTEFRNIGGVASVNYKFKDRYMVQTTIRTDASSSFGNSNRWGTFASLSGAWRFSDEPFLDLWDFLGESKLKASWGQVGRQPGSNHTYSRFALYESIGGGKYMNNSAVGPTRVQLDNLKWETVSSLNVGLETNLFDDRFFFQADVYSKRTDDLLFGQNGGYNIPTSSGFGSLALFNGGQMINNGWEAMINYKVLRTKNTLLTFNFNVSRNINKFTKLPDNFNREKDTELNNGQFARKLEVGEALGAFYGLEYEGVYHNAESTFARDANGNVLVDGAGIPMPMTYKGQYIFQAGDAKYKDQNNDGKIDINDVVHIGDSNPDFQGQVGMALKYKRFDLSFDFYYRLGFDIINGVAMNTQGMNDRNNQSKAVLRRWRVPSDEPVANQLPRAYYGNPANNLGSNRYVERGDFIRLNNVKIGYKLPKNQCDKLGLTKLDFSLTARKLWTLTNYSGQDPEVWMDASDPFVVGVDNARTPPSQSVTLNIAIGF